MGDYKGKERRNHRDDDHVQEHGERRQHDHQYDDKPKNVLTQNLSIKTLGAVLSLLATIGGAIWALDDRYVDTSELTHLKEEQSVQVEAVVKGGRRLFIMQYEDQLDDLQFKVQQGTATDFEKAKIERIKRRIESIRAGEF